MSMDAQARRALAVIRRSVAEGRYIVLPHFRERMVERGLGWPDILAVLDKPADVRDGGMEKMGRPKWIVAGVAADTLPIEMVCVFDTDERGHVTLFITVYEA